MPHERWFVGLIGASIVLATLLVGIGWMVLPALPITHQQARMRWEAQNIRRYRIEVQGHTAWVTSHALLEVEHERLVAGLDLRTGQPLSQSELRSLSDLFPVARLFYRIEKITLWPAGWRRQAVRLVPWLRPQLDPCSAPPATIRYHQRLFYPLEVRESGSPCVSDHGFNAAILRFEPLP